ncbi:hypothetical protein IEQ34_002733 [Dendrobium chrysotoxum]|uniref:Uncharacterized protein n=1 Tax=Dendrobium chrysotoxum TaxID=161865 RepID=A0AAV7H0U0_DENCH|nr:hypothetical protein IEQ34_002733 [Dendrobium chrysotoxum]
MLPLLTRGFPSPFTSTTITMHPILFLFLFLFLMLYQFLLSHALLRFDYPTAKLNTTWVNNPSFTPNLIHYVAGTKIRLLLLNNGGGGGPSFACGFFCAPPCQASFSPSSSSTRPFKENSPMIVTTPLPFGPLTAIASSARMPPSTSPKTAT